jgi:hypothetical protein
VGVEETMGVSLEIPRGTPWWQSMAIWTVPGNDPSGPPGPPIAGQPCHVWARVWSTGNTPAQNATVQFYWAPPGVGFDRTTATRIGSSYVSLCAPDDADVLCVAAWVPPFAHAGQACLVAEVFHPLDPLPPGDAFRAETDRHVAQRNVAVVAMTGGVFRFAFEVVNPLRVDRVFTIRVRAATGEELIATAQHLGIAPPGQPGRLAELALFDESCPQAGKRPEAETEAETETETKAEIEVAVAGHTRIELAMVGRIDGEAALLYIEQLHDGRVIGGLSVLVVEAR